MRPLAGALVLVASLATLSACTSQPPSVPASPAAVALTTDAPQLTLGVVVSLTAPPGEGAEWATAAEGAQVAAHRYRLGGATVGVKAADDKGSPTGAATAVRQLVEAGASGIVVATEGSHVKGALDEATKWGIPVLLPYEDDVSLITGSAWLTGPSTDALNSTLTHAAGEARQALVLSGGTVPEPFAEATAQRIQAGDSAARIAKLLRKRLKKSDPDLIVVTGPAATQAKIVRSLQGASVTVPTLLGPESTSPEFAEELGADGGSISGDFQSVGVNSGDLAALEGGPSGQAMSAFLAGLRSAATDSQLKDYFDGGSFSAAAPFADSRSHDAVIALVTAAGKAHSAKPEEVAKALTGLEVGGDQGLAGPALRFTGPAALPNEAVGLLRGTSEGTGLRPSTASATQLYWFRSNTG